MISAAYQANLAQKRAKWRTNNPLKARECRYCGVLFTPLHNRRTLCSDACNENSQGNHHGQRARRFGVPYETVNKLKVFESADWKCQICGVKCSPGNNDRPTTANLDHIIPLSEGGSHTYGNVRLLCVACHIDIDRLRRTQKGCDSK